MVAEKILVIGRNGQVATALREVASQRAPGAAPQVINLGRPEFDVQDAAMIARALDDAAPSVVINTAAFTAVDRAEGERIAARCLNAEAPHQLAELCRARSVPLIHLSTDYVFDGSKGAAYTEDDTPSPQSAYGETKWHGEQAVRVSQPQHIILRTAWVYGRHGHNFLRTMLRLAGDQDEVRVVSDQTGTPTHAADLADAILRVVERIGDGSAARNGLWGTYHLVAEGETTWHGFAEEIFRAASAQGARVPRLTAITSAEFRASAPRPAHSVLDSSKFASAFGHGLGHWQPPVAGVVAAVLAGS